MIFQFCWSFKRCHRPCTVRDTKMLFCWNYFAEEAEAGLKPCASCDYREAWRAGGYTAAGFSRETGCLLTPKTGKTILAVDDEPNILYALEELVRSKGHVCVSAADGEEGLVIARGLLPDLVITDIIMPKLSGLELCQNLKNDERTRHIPVIMVTVKTAEKDRLEGNLAGADAYLFKPFSSRQLKEKIELFLED